jgi:hypothetical protein
MLHDATTFVMISCSLVPWCSKHPRIRNRQSTTLVCRFGTGIVTDGMFQWRISPADQARCDEYSVSAIWPDCNFFSLMTKVSVHHLQLEIRTRFRTICLSPHLSAWLWELIKATRDGATPMSLLSYRADRQPCTWMPIYGLRPWVYCASTQSRPRL